MEVKGFDTSREELTKLIPELKSKSVLTSDEKARLKELQKKVDKCKKDMASCKELASKLEAEVSGLQKSILDAGGAKLKKQQQACEKILASLNDAEKALNSAKVAVSSNKKAATKAKKQMEAAEKNKQKCAEDLEEKETEFSEIEGKAVKVLEAYENVKKLEAEKRAELDEAKKECDTLKKTHADTRCVEIELQGQVDAFDRQLSDCNSKKKHWDKEIAKLVTAEEDDEFDFSDDEEDDEEQEEKGEGEEAGESSALDGDGDVEMENSEGKHPKSKKTPSKPDSKGSLPTLSVSILERYNVDDIKSTIDTLEAERSTLAKNANMGAIEEYKKKEADYLARYAFHSCACCIANFPSCLTHSHRFFPRVQRC